MLCLRLQRVEIAVSRILRPYNTSKRRNHDSRGGARLPGNRQRDEYAFIDPPWIDVPGAQRFYIIGIDLVSQMVSFGAKIADLEHPVVSRLILHVQVPLLGIAQSGIAF